MTQEVFFYISNLQGKNIRSDLKIIQFERQILYFNRSLYFKNFIALNFIILYTIKKHVSIQ